MNPVAARTLLSIDPTVVVHASRRLQKEQRRRGAKSSSGNPVGRGTRGGGRGDRGDRGDHTDDRTDDRTDRAGQGYLGGRHAHGARVGDRGATQRDRIAGPLVTAEEAMEMETEMETEMVTETVTVMVL